MQIFSNTQGEYSHASTQVNAPKWLEKKVISFGKENIKEKDIYTDPEDKSLGLENETHVTLKYGVPDSPEKVKEITEYFGEITVTLGKINKFRPEDKDYDVVIIKIDSDELKELNKLISDKLECTDTHPTYKPHMTIGYVKKGTCENLVDDDTFEGMQFTASSIEFTSKDGEKTTVPL